jgi:glycosyltransferase involved in cell wall biosynthesis
MKLDVIVPSFNRSKSLGRALRSLSGAQVPPGLSVSITVVDNNSSDDTPAIVEGARAYFNYPLHYIFEKRQGVVHARNTGIAQTSGDLIAFIDDDEEIGAGWYQEVASAFSDPSVDFIGGPYIPRWAIDPPHWVTSRLAGLLGAFNLGDQPFLWDHNAAGALPGGNAVIRRSMIERAGPFSTSLGVFGKRYLGNDDTEVFLRLLDFGANGRYVPKLAIYHHIPAGRLTKKYARKLKFWGGVSMGKIDELRQPPGPRIMGVPRHVYGSTVRVFGRFLKAIAGYRTHELFEIQLEMVYFFGFFYGRHGANADRFERRENLAHSASNKF